MKTPETIPTIDISPFMSTNASKESLTRVVDAVRDACTTYGFFQLVGHGVSLETQEKMLDCAKTFFKLSLEQKMEVWIKKSGKAFRGYEPSGIQIHQKGLLADTKEVRNCDFLIKHTLQSPQAFIIGAEIPEDDPDCGTFSTGPNLWPKSLPDEEFRNPIMEYQSTMVEIVKVLLKILALGLPSSWECSPNVFDEFAVKPSIPMRLLYYAVQPVRNENQFGGMFSEPSVSEAQF